MQETGSLRELLYEIRLSVFRVDEENRPMQKAVGIHVRTLGVGPVYPSNLGRRHSQHQLKINLD